jgi:hypothetical protein
MIHGSICYKDWSDSIWAPAERFKDTFIAASKKPVKAFGISGELSRKSMEEVTAFMTVTMTVRYSPDLE